MIFPLLFVLGGSYLVLKGRKPKVSTPNPAPPGVNGTDAAKVSVGEMTVSVPTVSMPEMRPPSSIGLLGGAGGVSLASLAQQAFDNGAARPPIKPALANINYDGSVPKGDGTDTSPPTIATWTS